MKKIIQKIDMSWIKIEPEYLLLVPRMPSDQYKSLVNSIKEDGQQVPIILNQNGVVLDGHSRLHACQDLGMQPKFIIKDFDDPAKEREFVVTTNLARRQLNLFQRGECCFNFYKRERDTRYQRMSENTWKVRRGEKELIPEGPEKRAARLLNRFGKMIGISGSVAHYIVWLIENADETTKELLRTDKITVRKAYITLKKPELKHYDTSKYLQHPTCLSCGKKTVSAKETGCHVHTTLCCTGCGWGN